MNLLCSILPRRRVCRGVLILGLLWLGTVAAPAQTNAATTTLGPLSISLGPSNGAPDIDSGIKILFLITLLSLRFVC